MNKQSLKFDIIFWALNICVLINMFNLFIMDAGASFSSIQVTFVTSFYNVFYLNKSYFNGES